MTYTEILGSAAAPEFHDRLHALDGAGHVEFVDLPRVDLARRRLRARTDRGREVAIALPRSTPLFDGAVLAVAADHAVVVRVEAEEWLRLRPVGVAEALALGYHAGNMHWRVRFDGRDLLIAVEGDAAPVLARLQDVLRAGRAILVGRETGAAGDRAHHPAHGHPA